MSYNILRKFPSVTVGEIISDRNNGLTFIRLLLSLLVLLAHSYDLGGFGGDRFVTILTRCQDSSGEIAVHSFMLLSGLLVSASFERQPLSSYLINRILRIFPGYLCSIVVIALFFGPIISLLSGVDLSTYFSAWHNGPWSFVVKNSLLAIRQAGILNFLDENPFPHYLAGSHWTIWPEFQGYIVIAICGLLGFLRNFRILLIPFTCFYILSLVSSYNPNSLADLGDGRRIGLGLYLLSGIIFYCLRDRIIIDRKGFFLSISLLCGCVLLSMYDWIVPFLLGYLILCISLVVPEICKKFEKIGDFSYGIYLYHFPILQILSLIGIHHFGFITYFGFAFLLTVPFGILSWFYIEKPGNSLKKIFAHP